jgi:hypothetical protein
MKAWEKVKKNYLEIKDLRDELYDNILIGIRKTIKVNKDYNCMVNQNKKYLELADNDDVIAKKFLCNAYPNYKEQFPEYFEININEEEITDEKTI